jgi:tRNA(Ile)-lysidine synthase
MTETTFLTSFSKYIKPEDIIVLAVSGWVDSMVLFDLVKSNHPKEKLIIAHFDHSLRWAESDWDRELIANICNKENISFEMEKMDIATLATEHKMSIESVARKYRYDFLFRIAEKYSAKYILTAHHADDRIETAIFNLIRGSKLGGIHALSLLSSRRDPFQNQVWEEYLQNLLSERERDLPTRGILTTSVTLRSDKKNKWAITIFRPLIHLTKKEICSYAEEKEIAFREDSSNEDTDYLRNHLRKNILPEFEKINPEYRKSISNFIDYTEELKTWIDEEIRLFLGDSWSFLVKDFRNKSLFFQKEIIRFLYEEANNGTVWLSKGNIEEILRFIITANGGTEKTLWALSLSKKSKTIFL